MNRLLFRRFFFLAAGLAMLALAGCATGGLRPLSSKPPRDRIVLSAPFTSSWWAGALPPIKYTVMLPAGEYRPLYEDDQYYYYQGPAKLVYKGAMDPGSFLYDGGMTVARGTNTPGGRYYVDEDGTQSFGKFETPPRTR